MKSIWSTRETKRLW